MTSRRDAIKQLGAGAAALAIPGFVLRPRLEPLVVAGQLAELAISSVSAITVRLTLRATGSAQPQSIPFTGALARDEFSAVARGSDPLAFSKARAGDVVVKLASSPPTILVETPRGELVQRLTLDTTTPGMSFALPRGPRLGLGEGGPQFERKGPTDTM